MASSSVFAPQSRCSAKLSKQLHSFLSTPLSSTDHGLHAAAFGQLKRQKIGLHFSASLLRYFFPESKPGHAIEAVKNCRATWFLVINACCCRAPLHGNFGGSQKQIQVPLSTEGVLHASRSPTRPSPNNTDKIFLGPGSPIQVCRAGA
jgi:hypothetical protein